MNTQGKALNISVRELNEKFCLLSEVYIFSTIFNFIIQLSNPFCKKSILDYNFVVDKILQMSQSYNQKVSECEGESNKDNVVKNEEQILKITRRNSSQVNLNINQFKNNDNNYNNNYNNNNYVNQGN